MAITDNEDSSSEEILLGRMLKAFRRSGSSRGRGRDKIILIVTTTTTAMAAAAVAAPTTQMSSSRFQERKDQDDDAAAVVRRLASSLSLDALQLERKTRQH